MKATKLSTLEELEHLVRCRSADAPAHIRKLNLDEKGVASLPDRIGKLRNLEALHLSGHQARRPDDGRS